MIEYKNLIPSANDVLKMICNDLNMAHNAAGPYDITPDYIEYMLDGTFGYISYDDIRNEWICEKCDSLYIAKRIIDFHSEDGSWT